MLYKFRCKNFRNFKDDIVFDFQAGKYDFSNSAIKKISEGQKVVKTALVYGKNGSGKTNLSLALMDISTLLTDNEKLVHYFKIPLANLNNNKNDFSEQKVEFEYSFCFDNDIVCYSYVKNLNHTLHSEKLIINDVVIFDYNHEKDVCNVFSLDWSPDFTFNNKRLQGMACARFIKNNIPPEDSVMSQIFLKFYSFVERMLWFCSLEQNFYEGFTVGTDSIDEGIIKKGKVKEFQDILLKIGIDYSLEEREINGRSLLYVLFDGGNDIPFFEIASKGTRSFALFYYWYLHIQDIAFLAIDEFDAYYHSSLAEVIVELLREADVQCLLTTHNTSIMSNELLRPDCYFNIKNGKIKAFSKIADGELRKIHNLSKMFKSGLFENV